MNIKNRIEYSVRANGDFVAMRMVSVFFAQGSSHREQDIRQTSGIQVRPENMA